MNENLKTVQEIENEIRTLPMADQLKLYNDMPNLISRDIEDLDWQRLGLEHFFADDDSSDIEDENGMEEEIR